jgi:hypothetical protein
MKGAPKGVPFIFLAFFHMQNRNLHLQVGNARL